MVLEAVMQRCVDTRGLLWLCPCIHTYKPASTRSLTSRHHPPPSACVSGVIIVRHFYLFDKRALVVLYRVCIWPCAQLCLNRIPLLCLYFKYETTPSSRLAWLSAKTGNICVKIKVWQGLVVMCQTISISGSVKPQCAVFTVLFSF